MVGTLGTNAGNPYPQIALLNEDIALSGSIDSTHFAIVYEDTAYCEEPPSWHYMMQNRVNLLTCEPPSGYPHRYQQDGYFPSITATTKRQDLHAAVIYQNTGAIAGRGVTLRSTQEFFGKGRPYGYVARGRELHLRINDSTHTGINVRMHDVWTSDDTLSQPLKWSNRSSIRTPIDSMPQADELLRTVYFAAHDSTMIGCELVGEFLGDSSSEPTARLDCIAEVVDSASGDVVAVLDSFTVSADAQSYALTVSPTLDLLSGTYYVRLRVVPTDITVSAVAGQSLYPVAEVMSFVDGDVALGKARRLDRESAPQARLSLQPNPTGATSEVRFSVPKEGRVWITLYDNQGRQLRRLLDGTVLDIGRYALGLDGSRLTPGVYLVELRTGKERVVEKMVITR